MTPIGNRFRRFQGTACWEASWRSPRWPFAEQRGGPDIAFAEIFGFLHGMNEVFRRIGYNLVRLPI